VSRKIGENTCYVSIFSKQDPCPERAYRMSRMFSLLITGIVLCCVLMMPVEKAASASRHTGVIVLDPGHGGHDRGAHGHKDIDEKNLTLVFTRAMAEKLKSTYKVVLTREDDYQVDLFERSALANYHNADLFISIHVGGSARSHPRGMSLLYHESAPNLRDISDTHVAAQEASPEVIQPWDQNRPDLLRKSRYLAELIQKRLVDANTSPRPTIGGAPLIVMAGVNMPGVLIEIGYITNPMDAKALMDETQVEALSRKLCDAINDFFSDDLRL